MANRLVEDIALRELVAKAGASPARQIPSSPSTRRTSPLAASSPRLGASVVFPMAASSTFYATAPSASLTQSKSPNSPGPRSPTQIMRSTSPMGHFGAGETSLPSVREVLDGYRRTLNRLHSEIATVQVAIDKASYDGLLTAAARLTEERVALEDQAAEAQRRFDAQQDLCASLLPRSSFGLPSPRVKPTRDV